MTRLLCLLALALAGCGGGAVATPVSSRQLSAVETISAVDTQSSVLATQNSDATSTEIARAATWQVLDANMRALQVTLTAQEVISRENAMRAAASHLNAMATQDAANSTQAVGDAETAARWGDTASWMGWVAIVGFGLAVFIGLWAWRNYADNTAKSLSESRAVAAYWNAERAKAEAQADIAESQARRIEAEKKLERMVNNIPHRFDFGLQRLIPLLEAEPPKSAHGHLHRYQTALVNYVLRGMELQECGIAEPFSEANCEAYQIVYKTDDDGRNRIDQRGARALKKLGGELGLLVVVDRVGTRTADGVTEGYLRRGFAIPPTHPLPKDDPPTVRIASCSVVAEVVS